MTARVRSTLLAATVAALTTLAALGPCRDARAAGPEGTNDERERERTALYSEGVALANAGRWEEAAKRFRQVVAIRSAPPALFTLAQAEEHMGQLATAERRYESALAAARVSGHADVADAASRALSAIATRVPSIVVRIEHSVPSATATIDGADVAFGATVKLDPGSHVVAAHAPDRRPFETRVRLVAGQSLEVPVELEPLVAPSPPPEAPFPVVEAPPPPASEPPAAPAAHGHPLPLGPLVLGGAGVATGIVGLVVRLAGQGGYDDASARCTAGVCAAQSSVDAGNSARTRMIVGTVILGAGVVAVAGAGVWWLTLAPSHGGASASLVAKF